MPSFYADAISYFSDRQASVCAFLAHSHKHFHSSTIPTILMKEDLWEELRELPPNWSNRGTTTTALPDSSQNHNQRLLTLFEMSHTMQFSSTLKIDLVDVDRTFMRSSLSHLVANYRYFSRSLKRIDISLDVLETLPLVCDNIPGLESLYLMMTWGADAASCFKKSLPKLQSLRKLSMQMMLKPATDALLETISTLKNLRELDLTHCSNLKDLNLHDYLAKLPNLEALNFEYCDCNGTSATLIDPIFSASSVKNLRRLSLKATYAVASFSKIKNVAHSIEFLDLAWTRIDEDGLKNICSCCSQLKYLSLQYCSNISSGFEAVVQLFLLESLNLSYINTLDDDCLKSICSSLTNLKNLSVCSARSITNKGLANIGLLTKLEELDLSFNDNISSVGIEEISHLPCLKTLRLCQVSKCDDDFLESISKIKTLEQLVVLGCIQISDEGVDYLLEGLKYLKMLDMGMCDSVSAECEELIEKTYPGIDLNFEFR